MGVAMNHLTLLIKTDAGRLALTQRASGLVPRLRTMLILVDGKRSVDELDRLGVGLGGGLPLVEQLLAYGWVTPRDLSQPFQESVHFSDSQAVPLQEPAEPVPVGVEKSGLSGLTLHDVRRKLVRFVNDQLGPSGAALAMEIEACKRAADLTALVPRIRHSLQHGRGAATVQRFDREYVPRLRGM